MALSSKIERSKKELYQVVASGDHYIFACYWGNRLQQFAQGNTVYSPCCCTGTAQAKEDSRSDP